MQAVTSQLLDGTLQPSFSKRPIHLSIADSAYDKWWQGNALSIILQKTSSSEHFHTSIGYRGGLVVWGKAWLGMELAEV